MDISDKTLNIAQSLIYREWAIAFDNNKAVHRETDDGSPDWVQFHQERLNNAVRELHDYKTALDEINKYAPLTRK